MRLLLITFVIIFSLNSSHAGEDAFVKEVMSACGKTKEEAESLGKGVTGPKGQFDRCTSSTVEVTPDCKVHCKKSGNLMD